MKLREFTREILDERLKYAQMQLRQELNYVRQYQETLQGRETAVCKWKAALYELEEILEQPKLCADAASSPTTPGQSQPMAAMDEAPDQLRCGECGRWRCSH